MIPHLFANENQYKNALKSTVMVTSLVGCPLLIGNDISITRDVLSWAARTLGSEQLSSIIQDTIALNILAWFAFVYFQIHILIAIILGSSIDKIENSQEEKGNN